MVDDLCSWAGGVNIKAASPTCLASAQASWPASWVLQVDYVHMGREKNQEMHGHGALVEVQMCRNKHERLSEPANSYQRTIFLKVNTT